ncbi:MAG: hypothetical protein E7598_02310 [Ruminococcaceae bacterium]|nr:hypothetical protein [Oscillospiraceae bacterium]
MLYYIKILQRSSVFMKIALPFENNNIFSHFEHASSFKIYEIENGKIVTMRFVPASDMPSIDINIMLCGNIGEDAKRGLLDKSVSIYDGFGGNADIAVKSFLSR